MDVSQALADAENALRDFIADTLEKQFGAAWLDKCGVSKERLEKWRARKIEDGKKQQHAGMVEERLLYYADFFDLRTILKAHWQGAFAEALGEQKVLFVLLGQLEDLRNPEAHRRELLPHQKNLAIGISGEIRGRIVRYRSKSDSVQDVFPRIEIARDSLGNTGRSNELMVHTKNTLRPGDQIDFVVTAVDPEDLPLEYGIGVGGVRSEVKWQKENSFSVRVQPEHIGKSFSIRIEIRSSRSHHAHPGWDDSIDFIYAVLPPKK
jgi:hypothetical protein